MNEIIIQDDCSTDGTVSIVEEYIQKYPNIKLFVNDHNLGFNQNFKNAAMRATGDYVAISDQDDVWFIDKIEKQVHAIGNYDICSSNYLRGKDIKDSISIDTKYNFELLLFCPHILGHTMLCNRNFIQDDKNWIDSIWYDMGLSLAASVNNGITSVEEPLNWHREHQYEVSYSTPKKNKPKYHAYLFGLKKYRKLLKNRNRHAIYTYLYCHTKSERFKLIHRFCELFLKDDLSSIFKLCLLCQQQRHLIYWNDIHGIIGWIRGFFIPFIQADLFDFLYKEFPKYNKL